MQKKLHSIPEHPIPEHPVPEPLLQKESAPLSSQRSLVCVSCIVSAVYVGRSGPYGGCTGQPQWKCVLTMRSILSASCSAARASRSS